MSLHLPACRVAQNARASLTKPSLHLQYLQPRTQRRHGWFDNFKWTGSSTKDSSPLAKALGKKREDKQRAVAERLTNRNQGTTIFDEEIKGQEQRSTKTAAGEKSQQAGLGASALSYSRMKEHMERALDPDPRWRVRYQRKKIMQSIRSGGKLSKKELIKQTEKELTSTSEILPTSVKKLVHLSHQIVGKTVDEAITQMRFSKKKMAREVKYQLEEARDMAIASRGMSLGVHNGGVLEKPRTILTKDGSKVEVQDTSRLYVDESWVTKGPYRGSRVHYMARGRMSFMWRPTTRISIVLKEEKTRIRQHEERVAKEAKKAPWVHLPNRPVTAQRQYYSW
ncbi:ribosomal protein L22/L17 [Xylariaceae sp. FL0594]|nr:ribosomal protein L22/L17 [Xylariaceae sp. FL0594]